MSDRKDATDPESLGLESLRDQAITWLVRVQSDAAGDQDWMALTTWLEASPDHLAAFEAVELAAAALEGEALTVLNALDRPSGTPISFAPRAAARPPQRTRFAPTSIAAALAALAVTFGAGWILSRGAEADYVAPVGADRTIALADGTRIHLDARTDLKVRLGWWSREVALGDGQAAFDVARDPRRPFLISVGDQRIRVVGTEFNVAHYDRQVVVTVRRGVVQVSQPDLDKAVVARLTVGQQLRHTDGADQSQRVDVDPNATFAWTEGRLICDDQSLSSVVSYLNHRYRIPIAVSPKVSPRVFSGVLSLGDEADVVRHLALYMSLKVERTEKGFELY